MLPNLSARWPANVRIDVADEGTGVTALRFDFGSTNIADVSLDLLGARTRSDGRQIAEQCVQWVGRACTERVDVGDFIFHVQHQHWHFEDYALYELRTVLPDAMPDIDDDALVASSGKVSFCLMDFERKRAAKPPTEDPFDRTGVLQGISPGWDDTYESYLAGQQIVIDDVPDGIYSIVVTANPARRILETSYEDNVAWVNVRIEGDTVEPVY